MVVVVGLLAPITAVVLAVKSGGSGGAQPLSDNFVTFGQHLTESRRGSTAVRVRRESRQEGRS
jgi:hypothetical protein